MKKIAVLISGCGNKDGAEITETVSLMIQLSAAKANVTYFSLNKPFQAKNFLNNTTLGERNMLQEAARITRSQIQDLETINTEDFDGLALPGGFGVASNLSNWGEAGHRCRVETCVERTIQEFYNQSKPIAAICIAPALVARVLEKKGISVTTGRDSETAQEIKKTGNIHVECSVDDYISDRDHKIISTPAYMIDHATPAQIFKGIEGLTKEFMEMA